MTLLKVDKISVFYGDLQVLWNVSLNVNEGEIVAIVGHNAAGKSTLLKTISGLIKPRSGSIVYLDKRIDHLPPHKIVELGIVQIPEGRRLFPNMSVMENLELGAYTKRARKAKDDVLEIVFQLFPILKERRKQLAGTLSGGEQQMLAIARGLMANPKLLMLDEPSAGLAPMLVLKIFDTIRELHDKGISILLVEQHVYHALSMADRGYVLEAGRIVLEGKGNELLETEHLKRAYLGM